MTDTTYDRISEEHEYSLTMIKEAEEMVKAHTAAMKRTAIAMYCMRNDVEVGHEVHVFKIRGQDEVRAKICGFDAESRTNVWPIVNLVKQDGSIGVIKVSLKFKGWEKA